VVQGRHRYDGVERVRLECDQVHVSADPLDASALVPRTSPVEHGPIDVETNDLRDAGVHEVGCKHPVATSDIENSRGSLRE
jgi:hypothetical protein